METKMKFNFIAKYASYTTKVEVAEDKYEEINFSQSTFATNDAKLAEAIRRHPYFGIEIHEDKVTSQTATEPVKQPELQKPEISKEPVAPATPAPEEPKAPAATVKKTFQCEKCKSKFASQTALDAHIAAMHS